MSVFIGGPYGRLAIMLNTSSSLNIDFIIIITARVYYVPNPTFCQNLSGLQVFGGYCTFQLFNIRYTGCEMCNKQLLSVCFFCVYGKLPAEACGLSSCTHGRTIHELKYLVLHFRVNATLVLGIGTFCQVFTTRRYIFLRFSTFYY